jgi:hypothetical protein
MKCEQTFVKARLPVQFLEPANWQDGAWHGGTRLKQTNQPRKAATSQAYGHTGFHRHERSERSCSQGIWPVDDTPATYVLASNTHHEV